MYTLHESIEQLHQALSDYIEATYHISAPYLIRQRKQLLAQPGIIHQIPYLESTPRYRAGESLAKMQGLSPAALEAYLSISKKDGNLPKLVFDPPYSHQSDAIRSSLIDQKNLIIMTGTGSGKTESFLLPILGKLAHEAKSRPGSFNKQSAMRALVLYPMNALVNDQLGRLRGLFGDPRIVKLFESWSARPPCFARYTSRTPYAGMRTAKRDTIKLKSFNDFYADIERKSQSDNTEERERAQKLLSELKKHGKWPAKPSLAAWLGRKGSRWQDSRTLEFQRAVTLPKDSELLTRHEVQSAPPDLIVTNYSMLEYMLMRPIERSIFDKTRLWLKSNPEESFLVVLDEAHLYRGAAGAEVGLLIRRLRDRLGIDQNRFQVICATASFQSREKAPKFGAQLSGVPESTFVPITGSLDLKAGGVRGTELEAEILSTVDLEQFYGKTVDAQRFNAVRQLLRYRGTPVGDSVESALYDALSDFGPMKLLINLTMQEAQPIGELGAKIFPDVSVEKGNSALTTLMALGSVARKEANMPGLLPCRSHNFFRGLPGLWVCMDPDCSETDGQGEDKICGKMYGQPREHCGCGARVLELYTCRNCGTAYARAYTDNVLTPSALWAEPGERLRTVTGHTEPLQAIDLLLEEPLDDESVEIADYDLETGRLNPMLPGQRMRRVFIRGERVSESRDEDEMTPSDADSCAQFKKCAVCKKTARFGRSYVQDHQTKGDQPFQALVSRQVQIQPPAPVEPSSFALCGDVRF